MIPLYLALFIIGLFLLIQSSVQIDAPDYVKLIFVIQNQVFLFMVAWGFSGLAYEFIIWFWQ